MKPKNFPARKLARQMHANGLWPATYDRYFSDIDAAKLIRTKKTQSGEVDHDINGNDRDDAALVGEGVQFFCKWV